jgi:hypothetical protein
MYSLDVKVQELAQQVANLLDGSWQAEFIEDCDWSFRLKRKDGFSLSVSYDKYKNKLNFKPRWEKLYNFLPYELREGKWNGSSWQVSKWDEINVSATRQPIAIAKDIERRLLPVVLLEWEKAMDKQQASNNQRQRYLSLMQEYAVAIGDESFDSTATKPYR